MICDGRWRFSASSYHCRSPRSQASISRLPSMVGGIASSFSIDLAHGVGRHPGIELAERRLQLVAQQHAGLAAALLLARRRAVSGVQPMPAAWFDHRELDGAGLADHEVAHAGLLCLAACLHDTAPT